MQMWKETPAVASVTHDVNLDLGAPTATVSVANGVAVSGATVAFSRTDGTVVSALTDGSGDAVVDVAALTEQAGSLTLRVSGANLLPYQATVAVAVGAGAHLRATSVAAVEDGTGASSGGRRWARGCGRDRRLVLPVRERRGRQQRRQRDGHPRRGGCPGRRHRR